MRILQQNINSSYRCHTIQKTSFIYTYVCSLYIIRDKLDIFLNNLFIIEALRSNNNSNYIHQSLLIN